MPSHSHSAAAMQRHHGLQGPRPATLKVTTKADQLGKKRRPVIIYVESPKVVHAQPSEFKSVVQRLTGAPSSLSSSAAASLLVPPPPQLLPSLPLWSTTTVAAAAPAASSLPAPSVVTSLGFFVSDDQLISPAAFLYEYDHQRQRQMVAAADGPSAAAANPVLLVPSSLGACYQYQGDLFVNQQ